MRIYIKQRGRQYFIHEDKFGPVCFHGYWNWDKKSLLHSKILNDRDEEQLEVRVGKVPWIGHPKTYILKSAGLSTEIEIKRINIWRPHFQFALEGSLYDLYCHANHKKSLYKNNEQVAKFNKAIFNWGETDSGFFIANLDEDKMLLLGLFLMLDMGEENGADVSADFGNVLPGIKGWDDHWSPNR